MKSSIVAYVGWLLLFAAFGFYLYGICQAIVLSSGPGPINSTFPEVLSTTISSIQALLLTNLGIVLGISVANPQSALARNMMPGKADRLAPAPIPAPLDIREKIQLMAVVVYVLCLIACLVTWIVRGFSTDPKTIVTLIPESGKMFIGVVLAYVTTVL